ncbi:MAG: hypothetical protein ACJA2M_002497 [Polaribacter sp.]
MKILAIFYANLGNSYLGNVLFYHNKIKKIAFELNDTNILKAFVIILVGEVGVNNYID